MGIRKDGGKMIRKIFEGKAKNVGKNYLLKIFFIDKFLLIGDRKGKPKGRITEIRGDRMTGGESPLFRDRTRRACPVRVGPNSQD